MTRQESFKRRVRARMERTGERYGAARRALLEQAPMARAAEPDVGDDAVRAATGRDWDAWCRLIDRFDGRGRGHAAIAAHLSAAHGVDAWWAQTVTVGYERIRGLRLPYQAADGTFTAACTRTVTVDAALLRALLLEAPGDLFPGLPTELRSRATSKNVRLALGPGVAEIEIREAPSGRTRIAVRHAGLPGQADVEPWKAFWAAWLAAVDEGAP